MNDEIRAILKSNQLLLRDRRWEYGENSEKAKVVDEQISELLNPKTSNMLNTEDTLGQDPNALSREDVL